MIARPPIPRDRSQVGTLLQRCRHSTVVWSWIFNGLRLASGLILLPLALHQLSRPDLGMYYVLLNLAAMVPLVDFGFGPTIGRFVSYAMGGAQSLQSHGIAAPGAASAPNYDLLWQLLFTTQRLYRYLTLALLVLLGAWGSYVVELRIQETTVPLLTRLAWVATLLAALLDIYSNWWVIYLRSLNEVLAAARIAVLVMVVRLLIAAALLLGGAGLLSLPVASLLSCVLQRYWARRRCYQMLAGHAPPAHIDVQHNLRILWPNSWRLGMQFISSYLTVSANTFICLQVLGLAANAQYGLSIQLLSFVSGMAAVWTSVKWPVIGQLRARQDLAAVRRLLWPRVWLQTGCFVLAAAGLLLCGPFLLAKFGSGKTILPWPWLGWLVLNAFLEMQFTLWGTLISMENRLPYLWPTVATNLLSLVLSLGLIHFTSLGLGALVLGPLLAGSLFNYWYWPPFAARGLGTRLFRFLFRGPVARSS